ncbi:MAG: hypothetical protein IOC80_01840 [Rhodobacter sp.]|nr:hypothetical protein [Rhodobacter sp.]MCA3511752.1 hypothetical protein [Rhodobacter sp.]MCA3521056.1 hypothetical protein [Rhodobacter sp.]MCA3522213.1 hypothetical protein [Rhodobacter sp.]MCA3525195.1 hypothetical protein [Rhodobacter sp.]
MHFSLTDRYSETAGPAVAGHAAVMPERPLLARGEPATGKTGPARRVAAGPGPPGLAWHGKSTPRNRRGRHDDDATGRPGDARPAVAARHSRRGTLRRAFTAPARVARRTGKIDRAAIGSCDHLLPGVPDRLKLLLAQDLTDGDLRRHGRNALPGSHGAVLKTRQDLHLFRHLAFTARAGQ